MLKKIINIIIPTHCPVCEKRIKRPAFLCEKCRNKLTEYNKQRKCLQCGRAIENSIDVICSFCEKLKPKFDVGISVHSYTDEFKTALIHYKFRHSFYRAKAFGQLLCEAYRKLGAEVDVIVAVPTTFQNLHKRGYNSSLEMAYCVSKELKIAIYDTVILKTKNTRQQSTVKMNERYENVKNAFDINKKQIDKIKGKVVLLIDDVLTTGATASECSKILKKYGATSVYLVTLLTGGGN